MSGELLSLVRKAFPAELELLRDQIRQLAEPLSEEEVWTRPMEPGNSIGNLVLHLTGNLNHFVGAQLARTGYLRDREREFTEHAHLARAELLAGLDAAVALFRRVVEGLTEEQLLAAHPEARFGTVLQGLLHLYGHFALHRGQMSYIARLVRPR